MKNVVYLFLAIIFGCSTAPPVSPGMTFLQSLNQYRAGIDKLEDKPERWPERQAMGDWLKNQYRFTLGGSKEFDRLVDLDFRRRELVIALTDPSTKPERATEIKQELAKIDKDAGGLIGLVKAQLANAEARAQQQPQRIEAIAAIGLLTLGIDGFSSASTPSHAIPPSIIVGGRSIVTDHGSFSTLQTPEGQIYRCSSVPLGDAAAAIKCDHIGK